MRWQEAEAGQCLPTPLGDRPDAAVPLNGSLEAAGAPRRRESKTAGQPRAPEAAEKAERRSSGGGTEGIHTGGRIQQPCGRSLYLLVGPVIWGLEQKLQLGAPQRRQVHTCALYQSACWTLQSPVSALHDEREGCVTRAEADQKTAKPFRGRRLLRYSVGWPNCSGNKMKGKRRSNAARLVGGSPHPCRPSPAASGSSTQQQNMGGGCRVPGCSV